MKKIVFLLAFTLSSASLWAQGSFDKFFAKYADADGFTVINITPKMFSMFSKVDVNDPDGQKVMQVAKKLTGLRIITAEDADAATSKKLYREAASYLTKDFQELMSIKNEDTDLKFMVRENAKGNIAELVMLVGGDEFVAITVNGDFSLADLSGISDNVKITGFDKLGNLGNKKKP